MDSSVEKDLALIAVVFSCITLLLLIVAVAEQEWVEVKFHDEDQKSRWGLWTLCTKGECKSLEYEWIKVSAAFVLISVILTFAGTVCGILGLKVVIPYNNRLWYLSAGVIMGCVGKYYYRDQVCWTQGSFTKGINGKFTPSKDCKEEIMVHEDVRRLDFDWNYGFGWGAFIFSAAASVFFFIPSGTKEISRKSFSSDI
ncbi:p53 apoptosis effector related to PMP-22-like [Mytilus edulis]|uniref:p53 apoptosis effector related to PMP-22-like n=1 Tax=Mytilus edulis TaxID=6550 RepID=UPI0039EFAAC0